MADYGAFPLWSGWGSFMIGPDDLALPAELKADLIAWGDSYGVTLASNAYEWPSAEIERQFVDRGRTLARRVAAALGTDVDVLYFDEETQQRERIYPGEEAT